MNLNSTSSDIVMYGILLPLCDSYQCSLRFTSVDLNRTDTGVCVQAAEESILCACVFMFVLTKSYFWLKYNNFLNANGT